MTGPVVALAVPAIPTSNLQGTSRPYAATPALTLTTSSAYYRTDAAARTVDATPRRTEEVGWW